MAQTMTETRKVDGAAATQERPKRDRFTPGQRILVVDDDTAIRELIETSLLGQEYEVSVAGDGEQALQRIRAEVFDLVIVDLVLPKAGGIEVMREAIGLYPDVAVIVISGNATVESAIAAVKIGAFDYLTKPFRIEELEIVVHKALERNRLRHENRYLRSQLDTRYAFEEIVGRSPALDRVFELVSRVAPTRSTVLITGASGTGKEMIARAIHLHSDRKSRPFISVNCGALPENLLEDELFGHKRGAFTDAIADRPGRFEQADGGTLFLDEIGEMPMSLQVKLLRVLQEREFTPLGGTEKIEVDVRILAATNQELKKALEEKRFREDLYYRLNVINIQLPRLVERAGDIPLLVNAFLEKFCARDGATPKRFSQDALKALMRHTWPGNVRELENVVERAVALAGPREFLEIHDLPEEIALATGVALGAGEAPAGGDDLDGMLHRLETRLLVQALETSRWVKARAAERLGIKRTTLIEKMKRLGIPLRPEN